MLVEAGDIIPCDGEVIEGDNIASFYQHDVTFTQLIGGQSSCR
ncbi:hypothetical protein PSX78_23590, partial [Shigella flexneri]|nr:hypothetical protein [Shigella flexneri]